MPSYSPDLNPGEFMWSKVKNNLRKIPKTKINELEKAVGESLSKLKRLDAVAGSNIVFILHNFEKCYKSCSDLNIALSAALQEWIIKFMKIKCCCTVFIFKRG